MLALKHVTVHFNRGTKLERKALRNFNLTVKEGEFITLIGSNGAGKSTVFNVISGEIAPTSGSLFIDGEDCTSWPPHKRASWVAKVMQDPQQAAIGPMTIEENLAFAFLRGQGRRLWPFSTKERRALFQERLQRVGAGLGLRLKDITGNLSGGQRQALSLMMATLIPSKILLLDEHTAALDPKTAHKVMGITEEALRHYKLTALMITHNMAHALKYGDRTLIMHEGKIISELGRSEKQAMTPADLTAIFNEFQK